VKLAFVVQRYGADIAGGSEMHCRQLAERLSPRHDITVLTTCARDYVTWENAYPPGASMENGVRVQRFPLRARATSNCLRTSATRCLTILERRLTARWNGFAPTALTVRH
jgi:hypothetical protein